MLVLNCLLLILLFVIRFLILVICVFWLMVVCMRFWVVFMSDLLMLVWKWLKLFILLVLVGMIIFCCVDWVVECSLLGIIVLIDGRLVIFVCVLNCWCVIWIWFWLLIWGVIIWLKYWFWVVFFCLGGRVKKVLDCDILDYFLVMISFRGCWNWCFVEC